MILPARSGREGRERPNVSNAANAVSRSDTRPWPSLMIRAATVQTGQIGHPHAESPETPLF
jgi:hypothetical protein